MPNNFIKNLFSSVSDTASDLPQLPDKYEPQERETYSQFGFRQAGLSAGNKYSLSPFLQGIYLSIKKKQEADTELQDKLRLRLLQEKSNLEAEQAQKENDRQASLDRQAALQQQIREKKEELAGLKDASYHKNQKAWTTLIISLVVLIPFTLYFFVFYSSVAYSAFFKVFDLDALGEEGTFKLSEAIFDAQALSAAWNDGVTELLFILLMPVIFLAFGFILNRWEMEPGKMKYIKIPCILLVAFLFDTLLSYAICEKIYNMWKEMTISDMPPYDFSIASQDPRFWVIICLGFVAYLIWGVTFGYFVKSIDELDLNKVMKGKIQDEIKTLEQQHKEEAGKITALANQMEEVKAKIRNIESQLSNTVRHDLGAIKLELHNFFVGWQKYLGSLMVSEDVKQEAQKIFQDTLNDLELLYDKTT